MFKYVFPIVLIVASNVMYNICQKSTQGKVNPFSALLITYLTAAVITVIAFYFYETKEGLLESFKGINWTSIVLGISIVGLELGYLLAYRAGWNIIVGSLVDNIFLALALIPIGIIFYHEGFGMNKVLGALLCIVGLILINK